jgi:hypothetical protein
MSSAPPRTDEQRELALARAREARRERADLRVALRQRTLHPVEVILGADTRPLWAALRVTWLLECVPGIGPVRAGRIMDDLSIAPSRRVRGLGDRQRAALIAQLGGPPSSLTPPDGAA